MSTERELSKEMIEFGEEFLLSLPKVDGFILKSKSPSCGIKEVKIYKSKKGFCVGKRKWIIWRTCNRKISKFSG